MKFFFSRNIFPVSMNDVKLQTWIKCELLNYQNIVKYGRQKTTDQRMKKMQESEKGGKEPPFYFYIFISFFSPPFYSEICTRSLVKMKPRFTRERKLERQVDLLGFTARNEGGRKWKQTWRRR